MNRLRLSHWLFATSCGFALVAGATAAAAADAPYTLNIPSEPMAQALKEYSQATGQQLVFSADIMKGANSTAVHGDYTGAGGLRALIGPADLTVEANASGVLMVRAKNARAALDGAASGGTTTASAAGSFNGVETVVVSAQKRDERLADVPVAVSVVNTARLTDSGTIRLKDYYSSIPGLALTPAYEQNQSLTIRGITTGDGAIPTVGFVVDDVPFGSPVAQGSSLPDIDPGDLDRIEVLRGPQGTLYGASSMGGLVKFVTKAPSMDAFSGRLEFGTESTKNSAEPGFQVRGSLNIPVSDDFALRVSAFQRQQGGYIDDPSLNHKGVNEVHSFGGRIASLWTPTDHLSISLSALYQDDRGDGVSDVTKGPGLGDLQQKFIPNVGPSDRVTQAYSATINADLGSVHIVSLTGYNTSHYHDLFDFSASGIGISSAKFWAAAGGTGSAWSDDFRPENLTQEIRATTSFGDLDVTVGGFLANDHNKVRQIDRGENPTTGVIVGTGYDGVFQYSYHEYAGFVDLKYNFTDRLSLEAGARYSGVQNKTGPFSTFQPIFTGSNTPVIQNVLDARFDPFTYRFTPQYKITDDTMVYATVSTGFRPGGGNVVFPGVPATFNPDNTTNYEIGFKGTIFDGALFVDASVYHVDWTDIQIRGLAPGSHSYVGNGGEAKSEGLELSVQAHPWEGVSLSAWGDYDNAVITSKFPAATTVFANPGDRLPFSATYSANFSANQEFPITDEITGFAGGAVSWTGNRVGLFQAVSKPRQYYPAYAKLDLTAGVKMHDWTVNLYANNLADQRGLLQGGIDGAIPTSYFYITPRTVGLTISKVF